MTADAASLIRQALPEVASLMSLAYKRAGSISADHALSQAGLQDGERIVLDYLERNEVGIAFEHLLDMVTEPRLSVSAHSLKCIQAAGVLLNIPSSKWSILQEQGQT